MAAGLPVVAARVGGVGDMVSEGLNGYSFESGDRAMLLEGVRKIARDRATMRRMGQQARAFAERQSWETIMDEVIEVYAGLIAARRPQRVAV